MTRNIQSPLDSARVKVEHTYLGPLDSKLAQALIKCDAEVSGLCIHKYSTWS